MNTTQPGRLIAVTGLFVVAAVFIPVRASAYEVYTSPRNADVDARGARSVRIEASAGGLRVEGRSGISQVRVRGTARASRRNVLEEIKLIAERRGDVVFIKAVMPDHNNVGLRELFRGDYGQQELELIIEVPNSLPLDVADGSGEAEFNNTGALSFDDGSGNIFVRGGRGNVRITDGSGNITIEGVEGSVKVDDGSGNISARNVTGDFTVGEDGSGDIDVSSVGGTMRVENDGSGNIDVDRVAGDFVVDNDGSGTIRYATVKGRISVPERKRRG
ncbi:MAG: DUF4097 family beta strand repeat-containing protein [Gemmatimonadales bacterium]